MILDFFGGTILTAIMVVSVNALISALAVGRSTKLVLATVVGLWIGLQVSLATAGVYIRNAELIGLMIAAPLVVVAIAAAASQALRSALLGLPQTLLIGLHSARVLGLFFILLAIAGRLGGPFPQSAGWGDIVTGTVALPLAFLVARRPAPNAVFWWNLFGAADLLAAAVFGILSANGAALQVIVAGAGSEAVAHLPWSLIPTVLVPFYLVLHGIIVAQIRAGRPAVLAQA